MPNYLSDLDVTARQARDIERYWRQRGYVVSCTVQRVTSPRPNPDDQPYVSYAIESDMVNGWPTQRLAR